jgi:hypothetical protein
MLAATFPGGSARSEIKRRVLMKAEHENESKSALTSGVIEEIVEDLIKKSAIAHELEEEQKIKKFVSGSS